MAQSAIVKNQIENEPTVKTDVPAIAAPPPVLAVPTQCSKCHEVYGSGGAPLHVCDLASTGSKTSDIKAIALRPSSMTAPSRLTITTFNILAQCWIGFQEVDDITVTSWEARRKLILHHIRSLQSHIVCLQEVELAAYTWLKEQLKDEYDAGPHSPNQCKHAELPPVGTCIFIQKGIPIKQHVITTRQKRGCSLVLLESGVEIYNTHLAWEKEVEKDKQQWTAITDGCALATTPYGIWTGDFNLVKSRMMDLVKQHAPPWLDSLVHACDRKTCWTPSSGARHLDYMLHGPEWKVQSELYDVEAKGEDLDQPHRSKEQMLRFLKTYGSDHSPLTVVLQSSSIHLSPPVHH